MLPDLQPFADYAIEHEQSQGPGDKRPTADDILKDEELLTLPNRLTNKVILITGGTSGLGLEVAKALHTTGAEVFISGRCNQAMGDQIADSISSIKSRSSQPETPSDIKQDDKVAPGDIYHPVRFVRMDLADLISIRNGADGFLTRSKNRINLLICNAGVMAPQKRDTTAQGHEVQFGVNHLAHFLLFQELCQALLRCSAKNFASRVVTVSSCAHRSSGLEPHGDYDFHETPYDPMVAYGQSKTANIYMANELERRYGARGLHGLSVHPGVIMETGLVRHLTDDNKTLEAQFIDGMPNFAKRSKNARQGAASIVWAAVTAKLEGVGGLYLEDCNISRPVREDLKEDEWFESGRSSWCYDEVSEERLWTDSEKLLMS